MNDLLTHGNVTLRALEPSDIDLLYEWENNSAIWEIGNTRVPFSRHILAQYLNEATRDIYEQKQLRLIIMNPDKSPVGAVDLFDFDPFHQRAGIGILIHRTEDRRMGYAANALLALENYCIHALGIRLLYANISEDNQASIDLFGKMGYQVTGIKKQWLHTAKGWRDEWLMQKFLVNTG